MNEEQKEALFNAIMLLEMVGGKEDGYEKFGTDYEYIWSAHSHIQKAILGEHSYGKAELLADMITADMILRHEMDGEKQMGENDGKEASTSN